MRRRSLVSSRGSCFASIYLGTLLFTGCGFSFGNAKNPQDEKVKEAESSDNSEAAEPNKGTPAAPTQSGTARDDAAMSESFDESGGPQPESAPAASAPKKAPRPEMSGAASGAFESGKKAFLAGDLRGALTQYKGAVQADSRAYEAHFAQGVVFERLGQTGKAVQSYRQAVRVVPDYEEAIVAYGVLLAKEGELDSALAFLQKKSAEVGRSAPLLAAMAEVRSLQGESGKAQTLAQESLKVDPSYKPAMVVLARDLYRARRVDLALYALRGILDGYGEGNPPRDKNNAEAHMLRGLIFSERGLRGPAMKEMKSALALRSDLVDAHLVVANYMMEAGNAQGAQSHLEMAIRYDNGNVSAHLQLGDAYRLLNRADDARRELEWVLAAEPNQAAAHYNLGLLFLLGARLKGVSEGQGIDKAIEHLEAYKARAERGGPDDVDDLLTRAKTKKALLKIKLEQSQSGGAG